MYDIDKKRCYFYLFIYFGDKIFNWEDYFQILGPHP